MRTICPACQTTFHVTSAQLRIRAGRVRCGKCASAFNALDHLCEDDQPLPRPTVSEASNAQPITEVAPIIAAAQQSVTDETAALTPTPEIIESTVEPETVLDEAAATPSPVVEASKVLVTAATESEATALPQDAAQSADVDPHVDEPAAGKAAADSTPAVTSPETVSTEKQTLTGDNSDYRRWANIASEAPVSVTARQGYRHPYILAAVLLALTLLSQLLFHFRTPLAIAIPGLWPTLSTLSEMMGTDMPLSRHIEQISIESSDLQIEPNKKGSLILQATLRNRADYPQAYPALELTLTDINDSVLVKRVFLPGDYLSSPAADSSAFSAHADLDLRMWLAASEVNSAGYRLYVFYP
ncbi:MAG TPA: DUF3426 domain-containing protein [Accumulibacter sp.]|mgnify:CR=1 FL=1|nr:DUF3426 domain-containing protein [Accumulibacter sp.]